MFFKNHKTILNTSNKRVCSTRLLFFLKCGWVKEFHRKLCLGFCKIKMGPIFCTDHSYFHHRPGSPLRLGGWWCDLMRLTSAGPILESGSLWHDPPWLSPGVKGIFHCSHTPLYRGTQVREVTGTQRVARASLFTIFVDLTWGAANFAPPRTKP